MYKYLFDEAFFLYFKYLILLSFKFPYLSGEPPLRPYGKIEYRKEKVEGLKCIRQRNQLKEKWIRGAIQRFGIRSFVDPEPFIPDPAFQQVQDPTYCFLLNIRYFLLFGKNPMMFFN